MKRKITYEQIRRLDPPRFSDLESTMRMLYDHGTLFDDGLPLNDNDDLPIVQNTPTLNQKEGKGRNQRSVETPLESSDSKRRKKSSTNKNFEEPNTDSEQRSTKRDTSQSASKKRFNKNRPNSTPD